MIPALAMLLFMSAAVLAAKLAADARHKRLTGVWEALARDNGWQLVRPYPEAHVTGVLNGIPVEARNVIVGTHKGAPVYKTWLCAKIGAADRGRASTARALGTLEGELPGASIEGGDLVWAERELDDPRAIERHLGLLSATAAAIRC